MPIPLSVEYILRRLRVDLYCGRCYWIEPPMNRPELKGREAGAINGMGYWQIRMGGPLYSRGYIIYRVVTGLRPKEMLDHKDRDRLNDRPANLREATRAQNNYNHGGHRKTQSTPMGVCLTPSGRFRAKIRFNKRDISLGTFSTMEAAHAIYLAKRKEYFGAFSGC